MKTIRGSMKQLLLWTDKQGWQRLRQNNQKTQINNIRGKGSEGILQQIFTEIQRLTKKYSEELSSSKLSRKPTGTELLTKVPKCLVEERWPHPHRVLGSWICTWQRLRYNCYRSSCKTVNLKWTKDLNIRLETLKLGKENINISRYGDKHKLSE